MAYVRGLDANVRKSALAGRCLFVVVHGFVAVVLDEFVAFGGF